MNYREAFTKYPLGREQFDGEWVRLWNELGRLLEAPASVEYYHGDKWQKARHFVRCSVGYCLSRLAADKEHGAPHRVTLLDGTVVKEWGAT